MKKFLFAILTAVLGGKRGGKTLSRVDWRVNFSSSFCGMPCVVLVYNLSDLFSERIRKTISHSFRLDL